MVWYAWVLIAELALSGVIKVALIGRPRKPVTHADAIFACVELGLLIWAVLALAT